MHHDRLYPRQDLNEHFERFAGWAPNNSVLTYVSIFIVSLYFFAAYLKLLPFTLSKAIWRLLVVLSPARIVFALDRRFAGGPVDDEDKDASKLRGSQAKSEAMQRILGWDGNWLFPSFAGATGYSSLSRTLTGSRDRAPPGLGNWDNSCYQNSIIQGLASLHSLDAFLESNLQMLGTRAEVSTHAALKGIIEKLNDPTNGDRYLWLPMELKSMCSWQQQDAQEYFSKVVEEMDREIRSGTRGMTNDSGFKLTGVRTSLASNDHGEARLEENDVPRKSGVVDHVGPFRNPLEGLLAQRVGCMRCGWSEGLSLIPFNCLMVSLGRNFAYDVRDCLDEYTALEPIEGVECAKCTLLRNESQLRQLLKQAEIEDSETDASDKAMRDALKKNADSRLKVVQEALEEENFTEKTLSEKCHIPSKTRVASTKSRQAVIARAPKSLVIHINRSVFDEMTGTLRKNHAGVTFPSILDLHEWCLGNKQPNPWDTTENWGLNPAESMLPHQERSVEVLNRKYDLRAVITHYGRHDNGHYICYRKYPVGGLHADEPDAASDADAEKETANKWFRYSDDDVGLVSESHVLAQTGVFMLFYESIGADLDSSNNSGIVADKSDAVNIDIQLNGSTDQGICDDDASMVVNRGGNTQQNSLGSTATPSGHGSVPSLVSDGSDSASSSVSSNDDATPELEHRRDAPPTSAARHIALGHDEGDGCVAEAPKVPTIITER